MNFYPQGSWNLRRTVYHPDLIILWSFSTYLPSSVGLILNCAHIYFRHFSLYYFYGFYLIFSLWWWMKSANLFAFWISNRQNAFTHKMLPNTLKWKKVFHKYCTGIILSYLLCKTVLVIFTEYLSRSEFSMFQVSVSNAICIATAFVLLPLLLLVHGTWLQLLVPDRGCSCTSQYFTETKGNGWFRPSMLRKRGLTWWIERDGSQ